MLLTDCFVVTIDGRHWSAISTAVVSVIGLSVCIVGVWVEAYPFDANNSMPWTDDIGMSGLVSPLSGTTSTFPVIAVV